MTESEQLNEQWENGVLPQDYYYVQYNRATGKSWVEIELKTYLVDLAKVRDADYCSILAPVPSYEEYKALQEENTKLKEQLKEVIGKLKYINTPRNNHNIFENDLMKKISKVLGEE
jgi:hypothetical protein